MQELFLSHNFIDHLPQSINKLNNLELLDVSYNRLQSINVIALMPKLRILNIQGNTTLNHLPKELATCDSLVDLVFDAEYITYPPSNIIDGGTAIILNYLLTQNDSDKAIDALTVQKPTLTLQNVKRITANLLDIERGNDVVRDIDNAIDKYTREKKFMDHERNEFEKYSNLEAALHQQQQKRKHDLLQHLLQQQNESDTLIQKMQKVKDSERQKLIDDILIGKCPLIRDFKI